jgi:16S rRNA (adenine1518-N6/adenine1519-N6)-dimethyltransferase
VSVNRLNVGDCVNNLVDDKEVGNLPRISCTLPHDGEVYAVFDLPAGAFRPPPKVKSSVLELTPREPGFDRALRDGALRLASLAFRWRRKTLPNALSSAVDRRSVERALVEMVRDPRARPEELSLTDYAELDRRIRPA